MAFISTAYLQDHNALEPPGELRLTNKQYTLLIIISGGWAESIHKKKIKYGPNTNGCECVAEWHIATR